MSLSEVSPLIKEWLRLGLRWHYVHRKSYTTLNIPALDIVQVPQGEYSFKGNEGALITFLASFDSPLCGIRIEANPELDTDDFYTVNRLTALGLINAPFPFTGFQPPQTPAGIYAVASFKEWAWKDWLNLYVFNTDTVERHCLTWQAIVAVLDDIRPLERPPGAEPPKHVPGEDPSAAPRGEEEERRAWGTYPETGRRR